MGLFKKKNIKVDTNNEDSILDFGDTDNYEKEASSIDNSESVAQNTVTNDEVVRDSATEDATPINSEENISSKKNKKTKKSRDTDAEVIEKQYVLYVITDRKNPHMLQYMRQLGLDVTRIFTNINDAKDTLLMQVNPAKIVIIDTGTGRFSTIGQRKELIDLMGIADDEAKISVYQTDSVLRSEIKYNDAFDSKDIHWHTYRSTADVVAHLLNNKGREKYIFDADDKEEVQVYTEEVLKFKGLPFSEPKHNEVNMGSSALTLMDILSNMTFNDDRTNEIESYVPRY